MDDKQRELRPEGLRITGKGTRLVPFAKDHVRNADYLGWLQDPEIVRTLNLPRYLAIQVAFEEVEGYCRNMMQSPTDLFLAIHHAGDGSFIGTAKAGHIDWYAGTADIGVMIGRKDLWGRGLASDALRSLCDHMLTSVGMRRLTAGVMAINPAMIRVFEMLGFRREGVFRQQDRLGDEYIDHIYLGCLRHEFVGR